MKSYLFYAVIMGLWFTIELAMNPDMRDRGPHTLKTSPTIGAAVVLRNILKEQLTHREGKREEVSEYDFHEEQKKKGKDNFLIP